MEQWFDGSTFQTQPAFLQLRPPFREGSRQHGYGDFFLFSKDRAPVTSSNPLLPASLALVDIDGVELGLLEAPMIDGDLFLMLNEHLQFMCLGLYIRV